MEGDGWIGGGDVVVIGGSWLGTQRQRLVLCFL